MMIFLLLRSREEEEYQEEEDQEEEAQTCVECIVLSCSRCGKQRAFKSAFRCARICAERVVV